MYKSFPFWTKLLEFKVRKLTLDFSGQQYVLHIFPPCEFVTTNLSRLAPDFLQNVQDLPLLMVVITGGDSN